MTGLELFGALAGVEAVKVTLAAIGLAILAFILTD